MFNFQPDLRFETCICNLEKVLFFSIKVELYIMDQQVFVTIFQKNIYFKLSI